MSTQLPGQEVVQETASPKTSRFRWVIMGLIFLVYTLANADRANLGVALPYIKKEFSFSNTEAGLMISLFFACYAVAQIPVGLLYRKLGPRVVMTVAMGFTSLSTWLIGSSSSPLQLKLWRAVLGIAEAPLPIGCGTTIDRWFPPREKGTAAGLFWAASKSGPVICPPICVLIIAWAGWRHIFLLFALPGIILSLIWFVLVRDNPEQSKLVSANELNYIRDRKAAAQKQKGEPRRGHYPKWLDKLIRAKRIRPVDTVGKVFRSWNILGNTLAWLCMVGIVNVIMAWIPSYLIQVKHFTALKMGALSSAPFAGAVLGNTVGGWISDRLIRMRRKPLMMVSALSTSIMMYSLIYAPNDPVYLGILLFAAGFLLSLGYSAFTVYPMGLANRETFPVAYSVVNTGGSIGPSIFPLIAGIILDHYNWNAVFLFLAVSSILCLFVIISIEEPLLENEQDEAIA
jgi:sugar phosphate permease